MLILPVKGVMYYFLSGNQKELNYQQLYLVSYKKELPLSRSCVATKSWLNEHFSQHTYHISHGFAEP